MWRRWPQALACTGGLALGAKNSEDRRGLSESKDGQNDAGIDPRTLERAPNHSQPDAKGNSHPVKLLLM